MITEHFRQVPSFRFMPWADPEGDRGPDPLKNHKNIGFPSNIDQDPLKITKLPSQHSIHASKTPFQRRFTDGSPFYWHFGPLSLPPLTKCSRSAHACSACEPTRLKLHNFMIFLYLQRSTKTQTSLRKSAFSIQH